MNRIVLVVCLSGAMALAAQTAPSPATSTTKPASTTSAKSTATTAGKAATATAASATTYKLPPGEKRIPGIPKTAFTVRYQDIKIGTGAEGEPNKVWHVKYKGWRAVDGVVFDSWENNKRPEMKDGKPVMGPDNKPVMGDPQPLEFPQGMGRLIPGFDYGLVGMHIGGKRRIFIPWQAAYGTRVIPDRPDHPGIPAKSDLIFDVELVDVTDMPAPPQRPAMMPRPGGPPAGAPGAPGAPGTKPATPGQPATPAPAGQPGTPPPAGAPATTPPPASTAPASTPPATAPASPGTQPQSKPTPPPSTPQQ